MRPTAVSAARSFSASSSGMPSFLRACRHVRQHALREDGAWADVIHENAVAPDFIGEAFRERDDTHARGAREREIRDRLVDGAREDVDDASAAARLQMRQRLARHPCEEEQRALHGGRPLLFVGISGIRERRTAGVVHEDVEAAEALHRRGDESADGVVLVEVAGIGEHVHAGGGADLLRGFLEIGLRAAADREVHAFFRQRLRARAAEAFAGAADDGDLPLQHQIHADLPPRLGLAMVQAVSNATGPRRGGPERTRTSRLGRPGQS